MRREYVGDGVPHGFISLCVKNVDEDLLRERVEKTGKDPLIHAHPGSVQWIGPHHSLAIYVCGRDDFLWCMKVPIKIVIKARHTDLREDKGLPWEEIITGKFFGNFIGEKGRRRG